MEKLQRAVALISVLPFSAERKLFYIESLISVVHNPSLLEFAMNKLINEITDEMALKRQSGNSKDYEKDKIEEIRSKLSSLT